MSKPVFQKSAIGLSAVLSLFLNALIRASFAAAGSSILSAFWATTCAGTRVPAALVLAGLAVW